MNENTRRLHDLGQRLWLDKSSRSLLRSGTLQRYVHLTRAADVFRPIFDAKRGVDGWESLDVSLLLADHTAHTLQALVGPDTIDTRPENATP